MNDLSRLSLGIADLPLTPFGMRSPVAGAPASCHVNSKTGNLCKHICHALVSTEFKGKHINVSFLAIRVILKLILAGVNKLSRKHLRSYPSAHDPVQTKSSPAQKENVRPKTCPASNKPLPLSSLNGKINKLFAPKGSSMLHKPTFILKPNSQMPALMEEDLDDVFLMPAVPRSKISRLKKHTNSPVVLEQSVHADLRNVTQRGSNKNNQSNFANKNSAFHKKGDNVHEEENSEKTPALFEFYLPRHGTKNTFHSDSQQLFDNTSVSCILPISNNR